MKMPDYFHAIGASLGLAAMFVTAISTTSAATEALSAMSQPAGLHVQMQSELEPLAINQMHSWVIRVQDSQGDPVTDARISVDGGMPAHNHGLATSPQVTENLGEGRYRLEGVRFHMNGEWELRLQIESADVPYRAIFTLTL
ncbi:MAG: FixH family protein [Pseudohongiella sp.]|uniref:FixH family protein n=1 Tax=Pseudohongiella sp. TaxID=1979412 RepID=UPI00349FE1D0